MEPTESLSPVEQERTENNRALFPWPLCVSSALGTFSSQAGLCSSHGGAPGRSSHHPLGTVVTSGGQTMGSWLEAAAPSASSQGQHHHQLSALRWAAPPQGGRHAGVGQVQLYQLPDCTASLSRFPVNASLACFDHACVIECRFPNRQHLSCTV